MQGCSKLDHKVWAVRSKTSCFSDVMFFLLDFSAALSYLDLVKSPVSEKLGPEETRFGSYLRDQILPFTIGYLKSGPKSRQKNRPIVVRSGPLNSHLATLFICLLYLFARMDCVFYLSQTIFPLMFVVDL